MGTFTNIQSASLMAGVLLLLAVTGVSYIFLLVYCASFIFAYSCTELIRNKKSHFNSQWLVRVIKTVRFVSGQIRKFALSNSKLSAHRNNLLVSTVSTISTVSKSPNKLRGSEPNYKETDDNSGPNNMTPNLLVAQTNAIRSGEILKEQGDGDNISPKFDKIQFIDNQYHGDKHNINGSQDTDEIIGMRSNDTKAQTNQTACATTYDITEPNSQVRQVPDKVQVEINYIIRYILRDFVHIWYDKLSTNSQTVQNSCENLHSMTNNLIAKLMQHDKYSFLEKLMSLYLCHFRDYQSANAHFKRQPNVRKRRDKEKKEFKKLKSVEDCFDVLGKFHKVVNSQNSEERELNYLRCFIDVLLSNVADKSLQNCYEAKQLLIDIVAGNVFLPLVDVLSDPHWLHKAVILLTSDEEIELVDICVAEEPKDLFVPEPADEFLECVEDSVEQKVINNSPIHVTYPEQIKSIPKETKLTRLHSSSPDISYFDVSEKQSHSMFYCDDESTDSDDEHGRVSSNLNISDVPTLSRAEYIPEGTSGDTVPEPGNEETDSYESLSTISQYEDNWMISETNASEPGTGDPAKSSIHHHHDHLQTSEDFVPKCLFEEIRMTGTETMKEPGGNGMFTLYCIEAVSWQRTKPTGSWILQQTRVKRRYREFLTLQDRLEQHKLYKKSLKGIKGPTRWQVILGKMDKDIIKKRQQFLQEYLKNLTSLEDISSSLALREFLAYDGDASIAFVRKASEIPRIDQVIAKKVSGVFDKLSAVFDPHDDLVRSKSQPNLSKGQGHTSDMAQITMPEAIEVLDIEFTYDRKYSEDFESLVTSFLDSSDHGDSFIPWSSLDVCDEGGEVTRARTDGDGCDTDNIHVTECDTLPLTSAVLNLALSSVETEDTWVRKQHTIHMFRVVLGKALENWLQGEVDDVTTEDKFAYYIAKFKDTLWPHGELDRTPMVTPSELQFNHTKEQAVRCLQEFFPVFLSPLVGREVFEVGINELFACMSHPRLNRHLVYQLMDWLIQTVFPDITDPVVQMSLLQTDPLHTQQPT